MSKVFKVAIIGLDTSHSVALPQLMQDPKTPAEQKIEGLVATRALRFPSAFQSEEGQDKRQETLESIGVKVTRDFDEAVGDCDAIMLEINDPALHLEYFEKCAPLGKPIFLDKPFADTVANAKAIARIAEENNVKFFTASKLRNFQSIEDLAAKNMEVKTAMAWGSLGKCPEGYSLIIWYGVHTFELLERMMGIGAETVHTLPNASGFDCQVQYKDGRSALVKMVVGAGTYGCWISDGRQVDCAAAVSGTPINMLNNFVALCRGAEPAVSVEESLEIMAMLEAAEKSYNSGKPEPVAK
jgi:predicted dehydrogenase